MEKRKVYICSPLAAATRDEIFLNMFRAKQYMRTVSEVLDCRAIAPQAFLPNILDDNIPEERELAMSFGSQILALCNVLLVCGNIISKGMSEEIEEAQSLGIPVIIAPSWLFNNCRLVREPDIADLRRKVAAA